MYNRKLVSGGVVQFASVRYRRLAFTGNQSSEAITTPGLACGTSRTLSPIHTHGPASRLTLELCF